MLSGVSGPLKLGGSTCGVIVWLMLAVVVIGDLTGVAKVKVRRLGAGVVSVNRNVVGASSVDAVLTESSCGAENVETGGDAFRDDFLVSPSRPDLRGRSFGEVDVSFFGAAAVSVVPGFGLSSAAGVSASVDESASDASSGSVDADDVEAEVVDVFVESSLVADEESDELDESDDVVVEPTGSASAIPGMVAAAVPTPSATASAPTLPTYLT